MGTGPVLLLLKSDTKHYILINFLVSVVSNSQDIPIVSAGLSGTEANPEGEGVALYHDGSALKAMVVSENRKWIAGSIVPLKECSWTHISVTWSKTNGLKFYKNRKLIDCQKSGINITDSLALAGQSFLLFGTFYNYSLTYGLFRISRLGIWKYELGPDDTTEIYGSGRPKSNVYIKHERILCSSY